MTRDATFEDGAERPLNLGALDADDLRVISALVQDAVLPASEIAWQPKKRRLGLLLNRLRRERLGGTVERVRSLLVIDNVLRVSSQGIDRRDPDTVLSVLSVGFEAADSPRGHVTLILAGDGALRAEVEALDVTLRDVTRPYMAPSGKMPDHEV
ncbi:DUF2948 family protein [Thetidibacter halocola]|uniref:DUF2948 family protein n=1 Tax=Thetidibacter halocola TaxID=2827239 RepID=A0A8J7WCZ1_9RHOB|nr:DUF2948 family protein [Thetidibacter halocola]MBS0123101.1 DUF2948 family protein [Thetidibacter halocola]